MDKGLPLDLDGLWRLSGLALALEPEQGSLFQSLEFDLPTLTYDPKADALEHDVQLELPYLDALDGLEQAGTDETASTTSRLSDPGVNLDTEQPDVQTDVWSLELASETDSLPRLRTWETFQRKGVPNVERAPYLSEAGPAVFDAALASQQKPQNSGVLPQDISLRALCNLALGRSSVFFQWEETKQCFNQTLGGVPTAGLTLECSHSFATQIIDYGTAFRRLQSSTELLGTRACSCAAVTSLKRSIGDILEAIERRLSRQLPSIRSLLQLQALLERPQQLLGILGILRKAVEEGLTEEQAISAIADEVHAINESGSAFSSLTKVILARVCAPWLSALAEDLGLSGHQGSLLRRQTGDEPSTASDFDLSLSQNIDDDATTKVLSDEDRELVKETKACLAILRQRMPDDALRHPVLPPRTSGVLEPTHSNDSRTHGLQLSGQDQCPAPHLVREQDMAPAAFPSEVGDGVWSDNAGQLRWLEEMDANISHLPSLPQAVVDDELHAATVAALGTHETDLISTSRDLQPAPALNPFDVMRPIVKVQSQRLNHMLLRHLFTTCELRKHLDLQRAFHLCGNGHFVTRLSTALFSPETQSAERKRGAVPTGETMGLRLGVREGQRWPPASSELRLTLTGVLSEAYHHNSAITYSQAGKQSELPGGLSFAIRELSEEEIDRVMDAGSIYALDFLRLQYTTPAPLDAVLSPGSMQRYDEVFRFLLRVFRVLDTTTGLQRTQTAKSGGGNATGARFAIEAHHFVSRLISYIMDIGIDEPWRVFQRSLDTVERLLDTRSTDGQQYEDSVVGINGLREMHNAFIDSIRTRLYLKRKHEKIRQAIENVMAAILEVASGAQAPEELDHGSSKPALARFRDAVSALVNMLRVAVDKPLKSNQTENDSDMATFLLGSLNWNVFYAEKATNTEAVPK